MSRRGCCGNCRRACRATGCEPHCALLRRVSPLWLQTASPPTHPSSAAVVDGSHCGPHSLPAALCNTYSARRCRLMCTSSRRSSSPSAPTDSLWPPSAHGRQTSTHFERAATRTDSTAAMRAHRSTTVHDCCEYSSPAALCMHARHRHTLKSMVTARSPVRPHRAVDALLYACCAAGATGTACGWASLPKCRHR